MADDVSTVIETLRPRDGEITAEDGAREISLLREKLKEKELEIARISVDLEVSVEDADGLRHLDHRGAREELDSKIAFISSLEAKLKEKESIINEKDQIIKRMASAASSKCRSVVGTYRNTSTCCLLFKSRNSIRVGRLEKDAPQIHPEETYNIYTCYVASDGEGQSMRKLVFSVINRNVNKHADLVPVGVIVGCENPKAGRDVFKNMSGVMLRTQFERAMTKMNRSYTTKDCRNRTQDLVSKLDYMDVLSKLSRYMGPTSKVLAVGGWMLKGGDKKKLRREDVEERDLIHILSTTPAASLKRNGDLEMRTVYENSSTVRVFSKGGGSKKLSDSSDDDDENSSKRQRVV
ncbi:hypothetical protein Pcinc_020666 [Petrolisthes cinctipes]|uniref:Uncharacterized protein n=1 Tax=Petrolisthes cinctipes TaxID=88211 RepID=A0AAE1KG39_PETCI|nr:hypothetical protein Pcinc_020666 [Petrolisthes cinctipes]